MGTGGNDAATKTILLPEDLEKALVTSKKEHVEWVIAAKRKEIRQERITGTIEGLKKGWANTTNL